MLAIGVTALECRRYLPPRVDVGGGLARVREPKMEGAKIEKDDGTRTVIFTIGVAAPRCRHNLVPRAGQLI